MGELRILAEESLSYEGLFDAHELYRLIDEFFATKSYDKVEKMNNEVVTESGKDITIIYRPYKKLSDYYKSVIQIKIFLRHLVDVDIEMDGKRKKLKKGDVSLNFKFMLESDYEGRWEQRGIYFMVRTIFDKIIYNTQQNHFEKQVLTDGRDLKDRIGSFLNLSHYKKG